MRITSRGKTIAFFITLGACLVALAVFLNVSWVVYHWRSVVPLVLGIVFFGVIIAGLVVNTIFIVREIRRNERHDTFLNAVTHELKTPITSIRLYLETLQSRPLDEAQRRDFYRIMLEDSERLLGTVEQVLKAGETRHLTHKRNWQEINFGAIAMQPMGKIAGSAASLQGVISTIGGAALGSLIGHQWSGSVFFLPAGAFCCASWVTAIDARSARLPAKVTFRSTWRIQEIPPA